MYSSKLAIIAFFLVSIMLASCSSTYSSLTRYPYSYQPEQLKPKQSTVIIADINFGAPSRHYLREHESHIDQSVKDYLLSNGHKVLSSQMFNRIWQKHIKYAGSLHNPVTGKQTASFTKAINQTLSEIFSKHPQLTAVVFTDLIESPIKLGNISNRTAQWDGAVRKIKFKGVGSGSIEGNDWVAAIDGISIRTIIIDRNSQIALQNQGAIQVAQALIVHNKNAKFSRRKDLLSNAGEISSGIALSLYPFIAMKNYPK